MVAASLLAAGLGTSEKTIMRSLFGFGLKWSRLVRLMGGAEAQVNDESIEDTLADLANYANMELLERRIDKLREWPEV